MISRTVRVSSVIIAAMMPSTAWAQLYSNTLGDPGISAGNSINAFAVHNDGTEETLYACGYFTAPGSNIARWDGSAWEPLGGGLLNWYCRDIISYQGSLIAGGYFDSASGVPGSAKLARWDGGQWYSMDAQIETVQQQIWALEVWDDGLTGEQLYIAGQYTGLNGQAGLDYIAKWDGSTYSAVGGTISIAADLGVRCLHVSDLSGTEILYAGGDFHEIGGVPARRVAAWDGTSWSNLGGPGAGFDGDVRAMVTWDDGHGPALYVGGDHNQVAKWDGSSWSELNGRFDAGVRDLVVFDDGAGESLYALGAFQFVDEGRIGVDHIARWNGTDWEPVGSGAGSTVRAGLVYDYGEGSALILGGNFEDANDMTAHKVVAYLSRFSCPADLTGDGVLDFFDVSAFLNAFNAMDPIADFTGDGAYDFFDVSAFLNAYNAGCP